MLRRDYSRSYSLPWRNRVDVSNTIRLKAIDNRDDSGNQAPVISRANSPRTPVGVVPDWLSDRIYWHVIFLYDVRSAPFWPRDRQNQPVGVLLGESPPDVSSTSTGPRHSSLVCGPVHAVPAHDLCCLRRAGGARHWMEGQNAEAAQDRGVAGVGASSRHAKHGLTSAELC